MPIEFRYFRAPESEMDFLPGNHICSLCGLSSRCFSLDNVISMELSEEERKGKAGCYDCLRRDRFGFSHVTEVGLITEDGLISYGEPYDSPKRVFVVAGDGEAVADNMPLVQPPKPHVTDESVAELRRTPSFSTWQELLWPVHCNDFMAYLGRWGPEEFAKVTSGNSGRSLFLDMVDPLFHRRWPEDGEPRFGRNFVAFQCLHCQTRTGI